MPQILCGDHLGKARMGNEGGEEAEALLSQEQAARKSKAQETVQVSKSKMYSIFATILVLFGLLIATTASDWLEYKKEVRVEQEVVSLESMMETKVAPKVVNTEAAIENLILEEVRTEEEERERRKEKKIRAKAKKDKRESTRRKPRRRSTSRWRRQTFRSIGKTRDERETLKR